ncbi:polyhydroxyalkanoate granule-associated phasin [Cupriavidus sp. 2TAF22]|uniref:polyhydroxyalkanoate granule-associated phasin n=1 Tax=unclassified Cupriavidus TaxID=2640874 RepID=UPI003F904510
MPSSILSKSVTDASSNFSRLYTEIFELLHATVEVVSVRTARMAKALVAPDERDPHEFSLMGREKGEAASESIGALGAGLLSLTVVLASETTNHFWAASAAASTLVASRSTSQWLERQEAFFKVACDHPASPLQLTNWGTCLMQEVLAPIHVRATANAKRLGAP